ncbi:hypothetical protein GCM10007874_62620 [Labrys miyagiensis]|uniref:Uncharacterized protein n=1 Tax=Labrys miyagiensis TaxID=346912 RepID=A0ABQ6CUH6_9HYPH|nr:hypothetical protein [Labrys miyagiensis]GLS23242.1 hypothetical protein GCM10007874_62620 [Labrys miyagiensis]
MRAQAFVLVGLLLAYIAGSVIPLIPLPFDIFATASRPVSTSVFAPFGFGLEAFIGPLALLELAKLVSPRLANWQIRSIRNASWLNDGVLVVAMIVVGLQAYGIFRVAHVIRSEDVGVFSLVAGIASYVGATALLTWLAYLITDNGPSEGFWLLWILPPVVASSKIAVALYELTAKGTMPLFTLLLEVGFTLSACVGLVVANLVLIGGPDPSTKAAINPDKALAERLASMAIIWPPLLTYVILNLARPVLAHFVTRTAEPPVWFRSYSVVYCLLVAGLIMLFSWAYARRRLVSWHEIGNVFDTNPSPYYVPAPFWLLGLLQAMICVGELILRHVMPYWHSLFNGPALIVLVTVAMSFIRGWGFLPLKPRPSDRR